jgi:hypothetical protein
VDSDLHGTWVIQKRMGKSTAIDAPVEYKQVCQAKRDPIFKWQKSEQQESYGKE